MNNEVSPRVVLDADGLLTHARVALLNAYAPYSSMRVGAAALFDDGSIVTGVNVENASFGLTICAERCAIAAAVAQGKRRLCALAITSDHYKPLPPCGACRQVIAEFSEDDAVVILEEMDGKSKIFHISELLPLAYKFPNPALPGPKR